MLPTQPTIKDVGRAADVSQATVSYVLNNNKAAQRISKQTQKRVRAAAERLGYKFDPTGRALQRGYNNQVTLLIVTWNLAASPNTPIYSASAPPSLYYGASWNYNDSPTAYGAPNGKPDLQSYYQNSNAKVVGGVKDVEGWYAFLNYYFWMQQCVDSQIGLVLDALQGNPTFWANTVIILLSDHGDYGGSHWLKGKTGALYDEVINVPLYISMPTFSKTGNPRQSQAVPRSFVC